MLSLLFAVVLNLEPERNSLRDAMLWRLRVLHPNGLICLLIALLIKVAETIVSKIIA